MNELSFLQKLKELIYHPIYYWYSWRNMLTKLNSMRNDFGCEETSFDPFNYKDTLTISNSYIGFEVEIIFIDLFYLDSQTITCEFETDWSDRHKHRNLFE